MSKGIVKVLMCRVLHFTEVINRHDFIDTIIRNADPSRFEMMACTLWSQSNIAATDYQTAKIRHWVLTGEQRAKYPLIALELARLLKRERVDVLHTHHYDPALIGWFATRLYTKTRLVVGRHYSDSIYRLSSDVKRRTYLGAERIVNRAATRIIVPSAYIFEILTKRQGVDPHKIDLIPYGFEPAKYVAPQAAEVRRIREELKLGDEFVLGNFSRLHEEKGHRFLIDALAMLKPRCLRLTVLLVGEGAERASIERQIRAAGLEGVVRMLGWRRDAMTIMAAADAVAQPTLQEAFSQVMAEALWMRKPLIITDVSGAPDVIRDGQNGLLVPRGDAPALAHAIERLANDPTLRTRLGEAGRTYVEEHLVIDKIIPRYERA